MILQGMFCYFIANEIILCNFYNTYVVPLL